MAGLHPIALVHENTAAAVMYGKDLKSGKSRKIEAESEVEDE